MNPKLVPVLPGKELPLETPLWRYMTLGAFLLLLQRKSVFVPTLRKLQEGDPKEMRMLRDSVTSDVDRFANSETFKGARDWLEKKYRARRGIKRDSNTPDWSVPNTELLDEWTEQLGVRRCAWCWFAPASPPGNWDWMENMAMWNLYARNGVAIKTTLDCVTAAIEDPELTELLVAGVQYSSQGDGHPLFNNQEYAKRPFLFKSASYRYEQEVRLVFRVNAVAVELESGRKLTVNAEKLLKGGEVITSPFMILDEAEALIDVAQSLLPGVEVLFRPSSERSPRSNDPRGGAHFKENLATHLHLVADETALPPLLREL